LRLVVSWRHHARVILHEFLPRLDLNFSLVPGVLEHDVLQEICCLHEHVVPRSLPVEVSHVQNASFSRFGSCFHHPFVVVARLWVNTHAETAFVLPWGLLVERDVSLRQSAEHHFLVLVVERGTHGRRKEAVTGSVLVKGELGLASRARQNRGVFVDWLETGLV
jgi:hypothetical protein